MKLMLVHYKETGQDDIATNAKQKLCNEVHACVGGNLWNWVWDDLRRPVSRVIYDLGVLIEGQLFSKRK